MQRAYEDYASKFNCNTLFAQQDHTQNQNCLLVICPRTLIHQNLSLGILALTRKVNLVTASSAHSKAEIRETVREFQSLIAWERNWTNEYQSQPMGFEMLGTDDLWYACFGEQNHLWVYWLHPLDLIKHCYNTTGNGIVSHVVLTMRTLFMPQDRCFHDETTSSLLIA